MSQALRMGVVGCGAIAQIMHIPYIMDSEQFELVALADNHKPTLDDVANFYKVTHRYTDWRDLLVRDDIDAVVICHSGSHHDSVMAALDAHKHVFVEKPLAWNVREVEAVAARAAQSDRILQVGYHKLYDPAFAYTREHLQKMNDLAYARITVLHADNALNLMPYRIRRGNGVISEGYPDLPSWDQFPNSMLGTASGELAPLVDEALGARKNQKRLRVIYGMLTVSIIHHVYMLYGFLGEPTRIVSADLWRDGLSLHMVLEYPNDMRCTLDWHYLPYLNDYHEEYAFFGNDERIFVNFPGPYYRNFPTPVTIQGGERELSWEKSITVSYEEAFRNELLAFYDNVRGNKKPFTSAEDAVKHSRFIQRLIEAIP
jgi:predicted dehydrogenase